MITINMRSAAHTVKGQGVGSCYEEQVALVKNGLGYGYRVSENQSGNFDIVHYHTVNFNYYLERLFKDKNSIGVGYVHFLPQTLEHSIKLPWLFKKVFSKYLIDFYNSMDHLVVVNPYFKSEIIKAGITKPEIHYIPNFVSKKNFNALPADKNAETREEFGIEKDKFVVLGVGQLQSRKGVMDFAKVAKQMPHIQFVWAGGFSFGKISDGFAEIKALRENPPKNLKFIGMVGRERMNEVYNMADLMFLPSYDELFPMSILEAFACEKPVLLRDVPLYKGILFNSYLKGKNADEFAEQIDRLHTSAELYEFCKDKARVCGEKYSENSLLLQWRDFYGSIVDVSSEENDERGYMVV